MTIADPEAEKKTQDVPQDEAEAVDTEDDEPVGNGAKEDGSHQQEPAQKVHSINNAASIPDGGLRAWLQVLGAFFLFFNSWGIINTFGEYQTYYESGILASSTSSDISWIGSVQAFLLMLVGAACGPIYDAGYFRELLLVGSFMTVFGQMMLSLCTKYWEVLLAQAFCIGIGTGCLFVPSVAILSTYFTSKLATATGLAASGSSLGGVLYPIILHRLIGQIGFPWATRVIGFIILVTLAVPNLVMKVRVRPSSRRKMVDLPAFKEPPYLLFVLGGLVGFMGLYVAFFYVQLYAIDNQITNENLAFYLLAVINSASIFGRILPNLIADRLGPLNIIVPCALVSGILTLCLIAVDSLAGLIIFCILYGFFSGTFVSLPPTILVHLSLKNRAMIGTRMGMGFAVISIGLLIGTPIAGAILNAKGFTPTWIFGGVTTIAGACLMAAARVFKVGAAVNIKA
ncbi:MFS general substrate transporter [Saccharata proteae CBS 121410]|uniref:MFS general substrate transporter n=1 Tax=Saccharata proteae CBS 121410 TaxID=1314787 RepID=A0A9P4LY62_9PEZI|nr:MFS general substrate transporter [Saccharata proteae CBS 121410]